MTRSSCSYLQVEKRAICLFPEKEPCLRDRILYLSYLVFILPREMAIVIWVFVCFQKNKFSSPCFSKIASFIILINPHPLMILLKTLFLGSHYPGVGLLNLQDLVLQSGYAHFLKKVLFLLLLRSTVVCSPTKLWYEHAAS